MWCSHCTTSVLYLCLSDYVRLLNLTGQMKTARRHSVVDMQFEFRIEALGNDVHINVFAHLVILILRILWVAYSFFSAAYFYLMFAFCLTSVRAVLEYYANAIHLNLNGARKLYMCRIMAQYLVGLVV